MINIPDKMSNELSLCPPPQLVYYSLYINVFIFVITKFANWSFL